MTASSKTINQQLSDQWLKNFSQNAVETVRVVDGIVMFNHATGVMRAEWSNGQTEHWDACSKGYSINTATASFRDCVERWSEQ